MQMGMGWAVGVMARSELFVSSCLEIGWASIV